MRARSLNCNEIVARRRDAISKINRFTMAHQLDHPSVVQLACCMINAQSAMSPHTNNRKTSSKVTCRVYTRQSRVTSWWTISCRDNAGEKRTSVHSVGQVRHQVCIGVVITHLQPPTRPAGLLYMHVLNPQLIIPAYGLPLYLSILAKRLLWFTAEDCNHSKHRVLQEPLWWCSLTTPTEVYWVFILSCCATAAWLASWERIFTQSTNCNIVEIKRVAITSARTKYSPNCKSSRWRKIWLNGRELSN
jgi:hypothetical protein